MNGDWISNLINEDFSFESDVEAFPKSQDKKIFFVVRVGNNDMPCSANDLEMVQKALNTASFLYDDMKDMKFFVVPHTITFEEINVNVSVVK